MVGLNWGAFAARARARTERAFSELARLYESGRLSPLICGRYPLDELPHALSLLAGRHSYGKVIITP